MPLANDVRQGKPIVVEPVCALQRKLYRAAKQSRSRRFHALFDKVHRRDVLGRAWQEVARKRGAPGVDGVRIEDIEAAGLDVFLAELGDELRAGRYRPLPVRRVSIPKRQGGERHLGVPAVRDRVVQAAARLVLEPILRRTLPRSRSVSGRSAQRCKLGSACGPGSGETGSGWWTPTSVLSLITSIIACCCGSSASG